jgi:hypothetical protein
MIGPFPHKLGFGEGSARPAEDSEKQEACSIPGFIHANGKIGYRIFPRALPYI